MEVQNHLTMSDLKCIAAEFLLHSALKALSELPEFAWLLQKLPGNVRELIYLKSISTNRVRVCG